MINSNWITAYLFGRKLVSNFTIHWLYMLRPYRAIILVYNHFRCNTLYFQKCEQRDCIKMWWTADMIMLTFCAPSKEIAIFTPQTFLIWNAVNATNYKILNENMPHIRWTLFAIFLARDRPIDIMMVTCTNSLVFDKLDNSFVDWNSLWKFMIKHNQSSNFDSYVVKKQHGNQAIKDKQMGF